MLCSSKFINPENFNRFPKFPHFRRLARLINHLMIFSFFIMTFDAVSQRAIAGSCTITSVVAMSFGSYDVFSNTPKEAIGSVTYRCTDLGSGLITVDLSKGNSSTYAIRTLRSGNEVLNYNLYLDAGHNTIWGDGTEGSSRYGPLNPANNSEVLLSIYGRIPPQQTNVKVGNYSDMITITISF